MNRRRQATAREVLLEVFGKEHERLIDASLQDLNMFDVQRHVDRFFSQFSEPERAAPLDDEFSNFDPEEDTEEEDETLQDVF